MTAAITLLHVDPYTLSEDDLEARHRLMTDHLRNLKEKPDAGAWRCEMRLVASALHVVKRGIAREISPGDALVLPWWNLAPVQSHRFPQAAVLQRDHRYIVHCALYLPDIDRSGRYQWKIIVRETMRYKDRHGYEPTYLFSRFKRAESVVSTSSPNAQL